MHFTDIFIKRPVLGTVISLLILVLGLGSLDLLPIRQFPFTQNAVITVSTTYTGADPSLQRTSLMPWQQVILSQQSGALLTPDLIL